MTLLSSSNETKKSVKVRVPINIALIKYWGKRDEELILPLNDSISLSINDVYAETLLTFSSDLEDSVKINGKNTILRPGDRYDRCFSEARRLLRKRKRLIMEDGDHDSFSSFQIESTTNFPVAAGLASSAAGFAAIAFALGEMFQFSSKEVSRIARIGSGSACRSVVEGLVRWRAGADSSGIDCFAESLHPMSHWPDLRAIIVVLSDQEKEIGSSIGMKRSAETSTLLKYRVQSVVPERAERLSEAFADRNFSDFARITMQDSNQFHAVCLDTFPPLRYLSDASWEVIRLVNSFNSSEYRAAYSFDAGPNATVFLPSQYVIAFLHELSLIFSLSSDHISSLSRSCQAEFSDQLNNLKTHDGKPIKNIILSKVGAGPSVIDTIS